MDDKSTIWKPIHSFNKRKYLDTRLVFILLMLLCMCVYTLSMCYSGKCALKDIPAIILSPFPLSHPSFIIVVAALIELSKFRLPTIASTLVTVLENISKVGFIKQ